MKPAVYGIRDRACRAVRGFFHESGYTEVETPVLVSVPAQETHIDAISCAGGYLRTSPEFHMKRLLAEGMQRIFQLGPCFRSGEKGALHNPEFTMVEWYCAGADYEDVMAETAGLVLRVIAETTGRNIIRRNGLEIDCSGDWDVVTVSSAFLKHAGWDPVEAYDADRFDMDLVSKVEPALISDRPVILKDYPAQAAAFARIRQEGGRSVAERWELYIAGLELANAYGELIDPAEQRGRLEAIAEERSRLGKEVYPQDEEFIRAVEQGIPACAGVALGLDRLIMLAAEERSIDGVRPFVEKL